MPQPVIPNQRTRAVQRPASGVAAADAAGAPIGIQVVGGTLGELLGGSVDSSGAATGRPRARRKGRRVVRPGVGGDPVVPGPSSDDSDVGWHEGSGSNDSNDDRLRRDVPPHW